MNADMTEQKQQAAVWFRELRNQIVATFERLEQDHRQGPFSDLEPGEFEVSETRRSAEDGSDAGGGLMSVMRGGRVFEKVGVNISEVYGTLGERAQAAMAARKGIPGMKDDPRFWASGISLVAHMRNPHVPAVHMNTRMFWTPHAWWFGGGSDLNPCIEYDEDTAHFHATQKQHLDPHGPDQYPRLKEWADEYFYIPHRHRARVRGHAPLAVPPERRGGLSARTGPGARPRRRCRRWRWSAGTGSPRRHPAARRRTSAARSSARCAAMC